MKTLILAATALALTMGAAQADTVKQVWNLPAGAVIGTDANGSPIVNGYVTSNAGDCVNGTANYDGGQCILDNRDEPPENEEVAEAPEVEPSA